jgi:hypothetical protein
MIRSLGVSATLLAIVLLMGAGSVSARTGGTFVPVPGSAAQINAVASAVNPSHVLSLWASIIYTGGEGGKLYGNGDGKNGGKDDGGDNGDENGGDDRRDDHRPTPEPSTILSFGAAILIGGGVLYARRLRRSKK